MFRCVQCFGLPELVEGRRIGEIHLLSFHLGRPSVNHSVVKLLQLLILSCSSSAIDRALVR